MHIPVNLLFKPDLYLDPGSGSFVLQMALAVLLGAGVAIRAYWSKIKTLFGGKKADVVRPDDIDEEDEN
jgi:hypothetical protein